MRVLVTGWFSFDEVIATIGDDLRARVVGDWLTELGIGHSMRLNGLVLGIRHDRPVIACEPIEGGAKVAGLLGADRGADGVSAARRWLTERLAG